MDFKKPRSDAKLLNLPEEQQAQLVEWLLGGMSYHRAKQAVAKEFGVEVRGSDAFTQFYSAVCAPHLVRRRFQAANMAEQVAEEARKEPGQFDAATVDALKQKAFELAISPMADPKDVKALFSLIQKSRDQDLKAQQIQLATRRVEMLESQLREVRDAVTKAKTAGGLTPEALKQIEEAAKIL